MPFPEKTYERLGSIWRRWGLTQEDVYYAIENGLLRVCVWLPMRWVERGTFKDKKFIFEQHEIKEGFIGVRPEDFHRICSTGSAKLRIFRSIKVEGHVIRLAYEPPQPDVSVRIHDLIVLKQDRVSFEETYQVSAQQIADYPKDCPSVQEFSATGDYRHITINGEEFHLGDIQASVVQQLHDASFSRNQWVHGKTLLDGADSRAMRLRDVFKSKTDWSKIIVSNARGYYRLNLPESRMLTPSKSAASIAVTALLYAQDFMDILPDCLSMMCAA